MTAYASADAREPAPLAPQQRGLWFLQQLRPDTSEYNLQVALRLHGSLDVANLRTAIGHVVRRHEPLRTRIVPDPAGVPHQHVAGRDEDGALPRIEPEFAEFADLDDGAGGTGTGSVEQTIQGVLREELDRPFDLVTDLPMRVRLIRFAPDEHLLVLTFNHLAVDGVSLSIVSAELTRTYAALIDGRTPDEADLPPLATSYSDFARRRAQHTTDQAGLDFWRAELDGVAELPLPADRPGHGVGAGMITLRREIDPGTVRGLSGLARESGTSLFSAALSCYALLLHRCTGRTDFLIGTPVAGRTDAVTQSLVGCFLNTVCVRVMIEPDGTVAELVQTTGAALSRTLQHQNVPFGEVVRAVGAQRGNARNPLYTAFCSVLDEAAPAFQMAGIRTEPVVADYAIARFDLNATFALGLHRPTIQLEFSDALFEHDTAERLADRLARVFDWVAADNTLRVSDVPLVGRAERDIVLSLLNGRRTRV
ncbi:condensation domain-containing protein [Solicola gregarius]|uniref:Condensation domain-containing protein n=1 Tax=Solicola gregarius TaxID=2908642 RepID=A0AA46TF28_9ACTN|nr:condensation domain-containing protein [Solicola gregarius]UYM03632.1 condensation domain-containing protein [Solicola gregarius]